MDFEIFCVKKKIVYINQITRFRFYSDHQLDSDEHILFPRKYRAKRLNFNKIMLFFLRRYLYLYAQAHSDFNGGTTTMANVIIRLNYKIKSIIIFYNIYSNYGTLLLLDSIHL